MNRTLFKICIVFLPITSLAQNQDKLQSSDNQNTLINLNRRISVSLVYGSMEKLRRTADTSYQSFYITDKGREGTFILDKSLKLSDDSSMVINSHGRIFRRVYDVLKPEFFGANPNDNIDDAAAFQKMLNYVPPAGAEIHLGSGEYFIGSQITFKSPTGPPAWSYRLNIQGAGVGATKITGKVGFTGDMFVMNTGPNSGWQKDQFIKITDIHFTATTAGRILFATEAVGVKIYDCKFEGGEICGLQFGLPGGKPGGYNCQFRNTYHIGTTYGQVAQIPALIKLYSCRFFTIDNFESDGGQYGIMMINGDKNIISHHKIEGTKRAGIFIDNVDGGSGENSILHGTINPYTGYERRALFDGEINGIEINSRFGANAVNSIIGNLMLGPPVEILARVFMLSDVDGNFDPSAFTNSHSVTGLSSGATGMLEGYDAKTRKAVIGTIKGNFQIGEILKQSTTHAKGKITYIGTSHSNAIKLTGAAGYSIIANNRFRAGAEIAINNQQNNNLITGNWIEATSKGILTNSSGGVTITSNQFAVPQGIAVENLGGIINYSNNVILSGKLINVKETYLAVTGGEVSGNSTLSGEENTINNLRLSGNTFPSGASYTKDLGNSKNAFRNIVSANFMGTTFQAINNGVNFAISNGDQVGRFNNSSGNFILGHGNVPDNGSAFQVNGSGWLSQGLIIGTVPSNVSNSAIVQINSSTKGILLPRMTTEERNKISNPIEGLEIYNISTHTKNFWNGTIWKSVKTD